MFKATDAYGGYVEISDKEPVTPSIIRCHKASCDRVASSIPPGWPFDGKSSCSEHKPTEGPSSGVSDGRKRVGSNVGPEIYRKIKNHAKFTGQSVSDVVHGLVVAWAENQDG